MHNALLNLYQAHATAFDAIAEDFAAKDLHGPFMISPNQQYTKSKRKLLIIGQETYGWGKYPDMSIEALMTGYESFNLGVNYKYKRSPFWSMTRYLENLLENVAYSCAWSNVNRYDQAKKRPSGSVLEAIMQFDKLLLEEIRIIKPDVCVFYTGPAFDHRLSNVFPGISIQAREKFQSNDFRILTHPDLPKQSFRIYHPGYLRRAKKEKSIKSLLKDNLVNE